MDIKKLVEEIVDSNDWLNGMYDYEDGDIMAIAEEPEKYMSIKECNSIKELFSYLKQGYEGTFKYKNLLFFNSYQYGTFVYDIEKAEKDPKRYVEHLTMDSIAFEKFSEIINELVK